MSILERWKAKPSEDEIKKKLEINRDLNRKKVKEIELQDFIGRPVICLSNEIQNLTVGFGKEIIYITKANEPMLLVQDIVSDTEILPMGIIFAYSEQKFDSLNAIEPNARIALFYNQKEERIIDKSATQTDELVDHQVWSETVKNKLSSIMNTSPLKKKMK